VKTLERAFEVMADAPDGIKRLRELILKLAVQGKLVPQDPNDEPASILLGKIAKEKEKLIKEGKINKGKELSSVTDDEKPYELPNGWEWVRLGVISSYVQRGKGPKYVEKSMYPVISQKCIQWSGFDISKARFIDPDSLATYEDIRFLRTGDLLWNSTGTGTVGRVNYYDADSERFRKVVADSHVTVIRCLFVNSRFLATWISCPIVQNEIEGMAAGSTNQIELNTSTVVSHPVPLPPLAEQKRIVEKVDRLMALCDKLEEARKKKEERRVEMNASALDRLMNASDSEEFDSACSRVRDNFHLLYDRPETVKKLRAAILQLAVQGKLVPQDPNDEPASLLLEKIAKEKAKLIKEGKIRQGKELPPVTDDEKPYELPQGWEWVRIGSISSYVQRGKGPKYVEKSIYPVISQKCVQWSGFDISKARFIDPDSISSYEDIRFLKPGDLLWNSTGTGTVGRVNVYDMGDVIFKKIVADSHVTVVRPLFTNSKYVALWISSPIVQNEIEGMAAGSTNQVELNISTVVFHLLPLPPLAEQKRIVEKVDRLMALCDKLETALTTSRDKAASLAASIVDHATAQP